LPKQLRDLEELGEYTPIYINDLLEKHEPQFKAYEEKFINVIDDPRFFCQRSDTRRDKRFQSVYRDKMTNFILDELHSRSLITQHGSKYYMPENAAVYYMSLLAQFAAEVYESDDIIIPSTDYKRFSQIIFESRQANQESMNIIFKNCLPVPEMSVPIEKIIEFKKNHRAELLQFRQFVQGINQQLTGARDRQDLKEILMSTKEKIELELSNLENTYKRNNINIVVSTMDSIFSLENPKLFESLATIGVISTAINPLLGLGIAGLFVLAKLVDQYADNKDKLKTNELNYLFEAKKSKIL